MLKILLDYDDVLNECNQTAVKKINELYGTNYKLSDVTCWGKVGNELDERIKFFKDPDFMKTVPIRNGAVEFVNELVQDNEVFIATGVEPECAGIRVDEIIQNFPMIDPANIVIGQRKDLLNADILLDDGYHNLKKTTVRYPVLWARPWNTEFTGIPVVHNYQEFLDFIHFLSRKHPIREKNNIILIGPSGSGKTTIAEKLPYPQVKTYTTRPQRKKDEYYRFISKADFFKKKISGFFVETTCYAGEFYGTAKEDIQRKDPKILIMDINGALKIKSEFPDTTVLLYIDRDKEKCMQSIIERGVDDKTVKRICSFDREEKNKTLCDHIIHNYKDINDTVADVIQYVSEEK